MVNMANLVDQKDYDALMASVPDGTLNVLSDLKGKCTTIVKIFQ